MLSLLLAGAPPNARLPGTGGCSALATAAQHGHTEVAKLLGEHQADPNLVDGTGVPPLAWAVQHGHREVTKLLLQVQADPNGGRQGDLEGAPLLQAIRLHGRTSIAGALLEHGANVAHAERTALHYAVASTLADETLCELLIQHHSAQVCMMLAMVPSSGAGCTRHGRKGRAWDTICLHRVPFKFRLCCWLHHAVDCKGGNPGISQQGDLNQV